MSKIDDPHENCEPGPLYKEMYHQLRAKIEMLEAQLDAEKKKSEALRADISSQNRRIKEYADKIYSLEAGQ